ncbi:MAG TPA: hypothetical protein VFE47_00970 [Tepidisphaeraceae bacterium]|nr:hypothetical protein [Tepidisphaeraceae bacterium]
MRSILLTKRTSFVLAALLALTAALRVLPVEGGNRPAREPKAAAPQAGGAPDVPALPAVEAKDEPGLILTIAPANPAEPATLDKRVARILAFSSPAGSSPSALGNDRDPYRVIFEGDINMRLRDFMIFSAIGHGKLKLTINDKPVLDLTGDFAGQSSESIRLGKGKNHVTAIYEPDAGKDAELRLYWGTKTSPSEPIPPMVFSHAAADEPLRQSLRVRDGRTLIGQLRCTKCHSAANLIGANAKNAMPELAMDAPSFENIGARLNPDWMAAWISNPRAFRPMAHMPKLFAAKEGAAPEARDIAAYLATLGKAAGDAKAADPAKASAGGLIFANLNCVACHISPVRKDEAAQPADAGRISLAYVGAKFKPGALKQFLLNPSAHYAWISMPNFRLSETEADQLAAFLLASSGKTVAAAAPGDAGSGMKLVYSAGCLNCHNLGGIQNASREAPAFIAFDAITKQGWTAGCMAIDAAGRKNAPDFSLTESQRGAILAFAATRGKSLMQDCPSEFSQRQIVSLRCTACHARDGRESLLATDLDAENQELHTKYPNPQQGSVEGIAPDQRAPMLTWAGEKLRPRWMAKFIAGQIPYKPRYYLRARMPGFGVRAGMLAEGLTEQHGCLTTYPDYPAPDKALAGIGQTLVGKTPNQSFGCVQCHAINQQAALAPFEAPAINFMYATARLRQDYYYRWIHNPLAVDPETKMPRFDDADGKTGVPVFDNDAKKQFEAIWNYLLLGKNMTPPAQ